MKVAIDKSPLTTGHAVRGIGSYTRNLIENLGKNVEAIDFTSKVDNLSDYDIIHYPYFDLFFNTLPETKPTKTVVTIHDVIPLLYPNHYKPGIKGKLRSDRQKHALKSVDAIITDSESSKKDIVRFLGVPQGKIHVVHLAAGENFKKITDKKLLNQTKRKHDLPDKFVLYVGDINYNKNIPNLVKACGIAKVPLVIVGKQANDLTSQEGDLRNLRGPRDWLRFVVGQSHPELAHYKELKRIFKKNKVIRVGYVSYEEFLAVYSLATVYCQASLAEGFGLPVLEAMKCNLPVVASKTQTLVEIAEGAALFADPKNPRDIAKKIKKFLDSKKLRDEYIKRDIKKAVQYSWKKTSSDTLEVYKKVLK